MPYSERVAGRNAFYLHLESTGLAMHTGALALFDAGPLTSPDGILDIDRIIAALETALDDVPHARQRLRQVPVEEQLVWVDDARFNLGFHVRHTRLPRPGTERQLKRLAGRLMSERLDRRKPLWQAWVIEGLEGDRVALMLKLHLAVLRDLSLAALFGALGRAGARAPGRWRPRPGPAPAQLLADSVSYWAEGARGVLEGAREALQAPVTTLRSAARATRAVGRVVADSASVERHPLLNPRQIGSHRRVEQMHLPLADLERLASTLDCTVADVALALLTGALRRMLHRRGERVEPESFVALVSLPDGDEIDEAGARDVSGCTMRIPLPLEDGDARRRVARIAEVRDVARASPQIEGFERLEQLERWTPTRIQKAISSSAGRRGTANIVVHFLDAPRERVSLLEATMENLAVFAPLFSDQALSVTILAYNGWLSWGINSDWDLVPDLHELAIGLEKGLSELAGLLAPGGHALPDHDIGRTA